MKIKINVYKIQETFQQKFCYILFININAFCSLTDKLTDKLFIEYMLIDERNVYKKSDIYLKKQPWN